MAPWEEPRDRLNEKLRHRQGVLQTGESLESVPGAGRHVEYAWAFSERAPQSVLAGTPQFSRKAIFGALGRVSAAKWNR